VSRVLLLDTGFSALPIYERLLAEGHEVLVCGGNPDDYLARTVSAYRRLDYSQHTALASLIVELAIDFVVPGCNDRSYEAGSAVLEAVRGTCMDRPQVTRTLNDKGEFRRLARRLGVPAPEVLARGEHAGDGVPALDQPLIVKPVDGYSGRGVTVLRRPDAASLAAARDVAARASRAGDVVVEAFVEGQLFSHSAFIAGGSVAVDFIVREFCSANPFVVDTSFVDRSLPAVLLDQLRRHVLAIAADLGLSDGLFHTQFILDGDRFWFIEVTRRCPGDLYAYLIESSTGYPYVQAYINGFLGRPLPPIPSDASRSLVVRHTVSSSKETVFQALSPRLPLSVLRYVPLCRAGDRVPASPFGRMGVLFMQARSEGELEDIVQRSVSRHLLDCG